MSFHIYSAACRRISIPHRIFTPTNRVVHLNPVFIARNYHIVTSNKHDSHQKIVPQILPKSPFLSRTSVRSISDLPTSATSAAVGLNASSTIIDTSSPVINAPDVTDLVAAAEPTFASMGLGGYTPVGIIQNGLEWLHVNCDLPWWLSIVVATVGARAVLFPVFVYTQRNAARLTNNMPEMQIIQEKLQVAKKSGNQLEVTQYSQELRDFVNERNCNPFKNLLMPLMQAPVFISFFFAISSMVNAPVASLKTGGLWWFSDLLASDSYYVLPAMMTALLSVNIQLGMQKSNPMVTPENEQFMKYVRFMPIITFPFTMNFAAAMLCYWTTTNFIALLQMGLFKIDRVRNFFHVEQIIERNIPEKTNNKHLTQEKFLPKDSFANIKITKDREIRRRRDYENFIAAQKAAQNPSTVESEKSKKRNITSQ